MTTAARRRRPFDTHSSSCPEDKDQFLGSTQLLRSGSTTRPTIATTFRRKRPHHVSESDGEEQGDHDEEDPSNGGVDFRFLVLQTGTILFLICIVLYLIFTHFILIRESELDYIVADDDAAAGVQSHQMPAHEDPSYVAEEQTFPPFNFTLKQERYYLDDAYTIAEKRNNKKYTLFWQSAEGLRNRFSQRYGNAQKDAARWILQNAYTTISNSTNKTACRLLDAKDQQRTFRIAFGGYSVTAGRGNTFAQSYPLVMESILSTIFSTAGIDFSVTNAAIGGCPSFPYGWCMENFWGRDVDVVSWDYAMNEAGGPVSGLDAYVRHAMQLPRKPFLIVKDTSLMSGNRKELLQDLHRAGVLSDALILHSDAAARPFLDRDNEERPEGFKDWRVFGAPPGAPGQVLHHPAKKEHEFMAWLLSMYLLSALELVMLHEEQPFLECKKIEKNDISFPAPRRADNTTKEWHHLFYGDKTTSMDGSTSYKVPHLHCRTSFEPIVAGDLSSLVVAGALGDQLDIMLPRSMMYYGRAWVMDMSAEEKRAKQKLDVFGGLGFVDSKKAYYGIYASGSLHLFLPVVKDHRSPPRTGDLALNWFRSLVFCEVNERRDPDACHTVQDVSYTIGGSSNTNATWIDEAGSMFMGKKICVYLNIPRDARLSRRSDALTSSSNTTGDFSSSSSRQVVWVPGRLNGTNEDEVGLAVEVRVTNLRIAKREQACSVSHVVWEVAR